MNQTDSYDQIKHLVVPSFFFFLIFFYPSCSFVTFLYLCARVYYHCKYCLIWCLLISWVNILFIICMKNISHIPTCVVFVTCLQRKFIHVYPIYFVLQRYFLYISENCPKYWKKIKVTYKTHHTLKSYGAHFIVWHVVSV